MFNSSLNRATRAAALLAVALLSTLPAAAQSLPPENATTSSTATTSSLDVLIRGMACPFCTYGVEKHLGRLPGARQVRVDLSKGKAVVELSAGSRVSDEQIREAVNEAGFTAGEIRRQKDGLPASGSPAP